MAYVVCAKWTAREGEEDKVAEAFQHLVPATRQEPGNQLYVLHRDPEDPRVFFVYEQYASPEAFQAHRDSEHFKQHGLGTAIPLLETRQVDFYETVDL